MKRTSLLTLALLFFGSLRPASALTLSLLPPMQVNASLGFFSANYTAQTLLAEVNSLRASNDLPPYNVNSILMSGAQTHAEYLASTGVLTQLGPDGKRPYQRALDAGYAVAGNLSVGGLFAENIHSGAGISPAEVVSAWRSNATSLNAMLSRDFKDAGAGMAVANGVTYYVLDVGASDSSLRTATLTAETGTATPRVLGTDVVVFVNTPLSNGEIFHVVQKDEALWSIAVAYSTTIEELKRLNGLASDEIFEGQTLLIQQAVTATTTASPVITATFGIPTSTSTSPVTPTLTPTSTAIPKPPASLESGGMAVGLIILVALLAAGVGSLLGKRSDKQ